MKMQRYRLARFAGSWHVEPSDEGTYVLVSDLPALLEEARRDAWYEATSSKVQSHYEAGEPMGEMMDAYLDHMAKEDAL